MSPQHKPSVDEPRRVAYNVLHAVGSADAYVNLVLNDELRSAALIGRDAGFVTEIVNGTLRMRGLLDAVIQQCSSRPLEKIDPRALDVLRLGAYQILFTRVDTYAAVNTSVELAGDVCGAGPKGFVNAILRKVSTGDLEHWYAKLNVNGDIATLTTGQLSVRTSHPEWIVRAYRDALGASSAAQLGALLSTNNTAPNVTLLARPGQISVDELLMESDGSPGRYSPYAVVAGAGAIGSVEAIRRGRAVVSDEGSQLVAMALANASIDGRDERWVDLCAGPGGKAALLSDLADGRGAVLIATDVQEHRARLVSHVLNGGNALAAVADGRSAPFADVDRILVDAPCTGIGVVRRRADLRWRRGPDDVGGLATLQGELLSAALDAVRPGGVVGYSTCSPHIAETDLVVQRVIKNRSDVELLDAHGLFPETLTLPDVPTVRLWPHLHNTDGMYFALMRRSP